MFQYPPEMSNAYVDTYRTVDGVGLKLWRFEPEGHGPNDQRPAIVFFFGGGFRTGSPAQFEPHARYLASRGMVAMTADYRVSDRHDVKVWQCVEDAKTTIRWIRENSTRFGIDSARIAASGGSAGGMLAAATAMVPGFDNPVVNNAVSSIPNALILFNPAVVLAPFEGYDISQERLQSLIERLGVSPETISPYHHIKAGLPPAIIFHGMADDLVAYDSIEFFTKKMIEMSNTCELVGYPNETHGFFNIGRGDGSAYTDTIHRMDTFLVSLGWLKAKTTQG